MTSGFISQLLYFLIGMEGWEIFDSAKLVWWGTGPWPLFLPCIMELLSGMSFPCLTRLCSTLGSALGFLYHSRNCKTRSTPKACVSGNQENIGRPPSPVGSEADLWLLPCCSWMDGNLPELWNSQEKGNRKAGERGTWAETQAAHLRALCVRRRAGPGLRQSVVGGTSCTKGSTLSNGSQDRVVLPQTGPYSQWGRTERLFS
jgi:hypothetical protein